MSNEFRLTSGGEINRTEKKKDDKHKYDYTFITYEKI